MSHADEWSSFLAGIELTELKLAGMFGQIRELVDLELDPLPGEWEVELQQAHLIEDNQIRIRVIAEANGPGGRLVVDGMGVFTSEQSLGDIPPHIVSKFVSETGFAAVVPTVRASFHDLNQRLELDAPRLGLFKFLPPEPAHDD